MLDKVVSKTITLIKVCPTEKHLKFLFELLKTRSRKNSISHRTLPTFKQHKAFVQARPYRYWFIIEVSGLFSGATYITKTNSVAIHLINNNKKIYEEVLSFIIKNIEPLKPLPSIRGKDYTVNLSTKNNIYSKVIISLGGKKVQDTYCVKKQYLSEA